MGVEPEGGCRSDRRERRTSELREEEEKKAILSHPTLTPMTLAAAAVRCSALNLRRSAPCCHYC